MGSWFWQISLTPFSTLLLQIMAHFKNRMSLLFPAYRFCYSDMFSSQGETGFCVSYSCISESKKRYDNIWVINRSDILSNSQGKVTSTRIKTLSVFIQFYIDYFPIPHNTLCLPPKFCITYCLKMLLGKCNTPRSI